MTPVPTLEIRHLTVEFTNRSGAVRAVDDVSIEVAPGKTVAIVGESGSGKSVTALSVLRLVPHPPARTLGGEILFCATPSREPVDLLRRSARELRTVRGGGIAMVFQEPMTALNPVLTIGGQIVESLRLHRRLSKKDAGVAAIDLLEKVGINEPAQRTAAYPHQWSGGMRQRAMIAMALAGEPRLLIADEPTTALDVVSQRSLLDLLQRLQAAHGLSILLITHDLAVAARIADSVCVMHQGRVIEQGTAREVLLNPRQPYTQSLWSSSRRLTYSTVRDHGTHSVR